MDAQGFKNLSAPLRHCSFHLFYLEPVTSLISSLPLLSSAILNLYVCMKHLVNGHCLISLSRQKILALSLALKKEPSHKCFQPSLLWVISQFPFLCMLSGPYLFLLATHCLHKLKPNRS